jgi:hypothetical protein
MFSDVLRHLLRVNFQDFHLDEALTFAAKRIERFVDCMGLQAEL